MTDKEVLEYYGWRLLSMPGEVLEIKKDAIEEKAECYADGEAAEIVIEAWKREYDRDANHLW